MTLKDIKVRVDAIYRSSGDFEGAHSQEDRLHQDVLMSIFSETLEDCTPVEAAREALKTKEIMFGRYCA